MLASEIISALNKFIEKYGDSEVAVPAFDQEAKLYLNTSKSVCTILRGDLHLVFVVADEKVSNTYMQDRLDGKQI